MSHVSLPLTHPGTHFPYQGEVVATTVSGHLPESTVDVGSSQELYSLALDSVYCVLAIFFFGQLDADRVPAFSTSVWVFC